MIEEKMQEMKARKVKSKIKVGLEGWHAWLCVFTFTLPPSLSLTSVLVLKLLDVLHRDLLEEEAPVLVPVSVLRGHVLLVHLS